MAVFFLLAACAAQLPEGQEDYRQFVAGNAAAIATLHVGMSKAELQQQMPRAVGYTHDGPVNNPVKTEAFTLGPDSYESLLYMTSDHKPGFPIMDNEGTPVIVKNGQVSGWGWLAYRQLLPANQP